MAYHCQPLVDVLQLNVQQNVCVWKSVTNFVDFDFELAQFMAYFKHIVIKQLQLIYATHAT